jgi:ADP-glucose pyrophosphorylase
MEIRCKWADEVWEKHYLASMGIHIFNKEFGRIMSSQGNWDLGKEIILKLVGKRSVYQYGGSHDSILSNNVHLFNGYP